MSSSHLMQQKRLPDRPGGAGNSSRESIHSGQFMVSEFEAEEQDDEDNLAVPIPEGTDTKDLVVPVKGYFPSGFEVSNKGKNQQPICIDQSLSKLFQCMSLAYRQKLTSPKWNRFRGIRLRWKDKIRLNNVIWRCWHLQFIKKENTLICQFASPLDVDTHNKPEAIVLEGKYWKRKLAAVTAEYKKWRMFYRNHLYGHTPKEEIDMLNDVDALLGDSNSMDHHMNVMMIDEDYMGLMSDTLFSTITNQPFPFPDTRELARSGFADFIQPSLGPLQPNLDDYMDTFDPIQDLYPNNKLPTVPEEQQQQNAAGTYYYHHQQNTNQASVSDLTTTQPGTTYQGQIQSHAVVMDTGHSQNLIAHHAVTAGAAPFNNVLLTTNNEHYIQSSSYPISSKLSAKVVQPINMNNRGKLSQTTTGPGVVLTGSTYSKSMDSNSSSQVVYPGYNPQNMNENIILNSDRLQVSTPTASKSSSQQQQRNTMQNISSVDHQVTQNATAAVATYKFATPSRPNLKFTSQPFQQQASALTLVHHTSSNYTGFSPSIAKINKGDSKNRITLRGRGRSRSNTREPLKRPPLISTASDPALISPQTNVLLTQLLTTNSPLSEAVQAAYSQSQASDLSHHRAALVKDESPPVLPSPSTSTLIPMTTNGGGGDSSYMNTYSNSNSPLDSPSQTLHSPTSSQGSIGSPGRDSRDGRRVGHIHAEQKRRCNIKNGFDMIHSLIPQLNQNPNAKLSKAAMLQKGAEYIKQLRAERNQLREEMDSLRQQIDSLNTSISNCQSMLPATGAPVSRRRDIRMQEMFDEYVSNRTMENWKFWIFSLICRSLLETFNSFVSTTSLEELYSSTYLWIEQHCTLVELRPVVLNSLRYLSTRTEILSEPEKLPNEARQLVLSKEKK